MKKCKKCGEDKDLSKFHKHKIEKDGYRSVCKDCRKIETTKYYKENSKRLKKYQKERYKIPEVKEHQKEYKKKYYKDNKKHFL